MENSKKIILDLCGGTGSWSKYYKENGYNVKVITLPDYDILRTDIGTDWIRFYGNDYNYLQIEKDEIYGILAAPPCTMFSIARNDKTAREPRDLEKRNANSKYVFRHYTELLI